MNQTGVNTGEIVMYQPDETIRLEVRLEDDTVWLTQQQMAELFQTTRNNVTIHIGNVYKEEELKPEATSKESLLVRLEGSRKVSRKAKLYNLDIIISVGYRVKSKRGTEFRQWAMGHQYHITVSGDDYYIDLLMYNTFMHRYLVIELKDTEFKPEYIGKLNFYCSAIDDVLCREGDNKTIGLLLCKTKDKIKAEYALRDIVKPIGISDYELGQALPKDLRSSLPSIEDIEKELF